MEVGEHKRIATTQLHLLHSPGRLAMWPYLAFLLSVLIYNCLYLPDGFCAPLDEGFLQSVAQRLVHGQLLYHDFQYWRTPLSVYVQASLIAILGDNYTILAARIFCVLQLTCTALLLSSLYRRLVSPIELFLLLCGSFAISSMLLTFPWYSYDAAFCAVVALVLF